jgi:hypothetical protein
MTAETSTEGSLGVQTTSGCTSTSVISSNTTGVGSQKKKTATRGTDKYQGYYPAVYNNPEV